MMEHADSSDQRGLGGRIDGDRGADVEKMVQSLALCQRELAQVRERQEGWMEQSARLPEALATRDAFAMALASRLSSDYWMRQRPGQFLGGGLRGRLARWILEFGRKPSAEWARVEMIEQSQYFDATWYLANYPDVVEAGFGAAAHYLHHGASEGRDPGPEFSTTYYLLNNHDVAREGANPLLHFLEFGQAEGRQPVAPDRRR